MQSAIEIDIDIWKDLVLKNKIAVFNQYKFSFQVFLFKPTKIKSHISNAKKHINLSTWLVVGLPVTEDCFEMGCHLSPSLISIRLTA